MTSTNSLIEAFYGTTNPENIAIPKSLAQKSITFVSNPPKKVSAGYILNLALFNRGNNTYSIHGVWLDKIVENNNILTKEYDNNANNISFSQNYFHASYINPLIISSANKVWYSGEGYPPNVTFWEHEYYKHALPLKENIPLFKNITSSQFLVTVIDLYIQATTKNSSGKCLADVFLQDTKIGDVLLIPLNEQLQFLFSEYPTKYMQQLQDLQTQPIYN